MSPKWIKLKSLTAVQFLKVKLFQEAVYYPKEFLNAETAPGCPMHSANRIQQIGVVPGSVCVSCFTLNASQGQAFQTAGMDLMVWPGERNDQLTT